jgi:hypothetical protein
MPFQSWTFNQLMSGAIRQEDAIRATKEEKKGKRAALGPSGGRSAQVPPGLHSTYRPAAWSSSSTAVVGLPYTSVGSSASASSPAVVCSTSSSIDCRARLPVLQLMAPWALCSRLLLVTVGLLTQSPYSA